MSSPSQIAGPSERLVSGQPASVSSPYREALENPSQDYHYAETLQNPAPDILASNPKSTKAPQVGFDTGDYKGTAEHEASSSYRPDTAGTKEIVIQENVYEPYREEPWYRRISRLAWLVISLTTLGVVAVLLAILGAMGFFSGRSGFGASTVTNNTTVASESSASPTTSAHSTATSPPALCAPPSTFLTNITWAGTDVASSTTSFPPGAHTAQDCCALCAGGRGSGGGGDITDCAAWLFRASEPYTPCVHVMVVSSPSRGQGDVEACPKGNASSTIFAKGQQGVVGSTAGIGPCGGVVVVK